jgi:hypothetical protein
MPLLLLDLFPQPFEVELVGGNEWEWLIPLVGPLAIAAGALFGVALSNRKATERHREQLEHDRDLQDQRLTHDRELHGVQLAQDRELRAMQLRYDQEIRAKEAAQQTVDEATRALTDAVEALGDFAGETVFLEGISQELAEADDEEQEINRQEAWNQGMRSLIEQMKAAHRTVGLLRPAQVRLLLRFEQAHPIYRNYFQASSAIDEHLDTLREHGGAIQSQERLDQIERESAEVARSLNGYIEAVRRWVASSVEPDRSLQ